MERLLIIDDEKSITDLLSVVFTNEGYDVQTALSAAKACCDAVSDCSAFGSSVSR